jgi:hypothetical protein
VLAELDGLESVDLKHGNGDTPGMCAADQAGTFPGEMAGPAIFPGVEQPHYPPGLRVGPEIFGPL